MNKKILASVLILLVLAAAVVAYISMSGEAPETQTFNIYMGNKKIDPAMYDCARVFAVSRTVSGVPNIEQAALESLLAGVTADESAEGYFTSIPDNVMIQKFEIREGVAYVDFNQKLHGGVGGACRVTHIPSQIRETLTQFPNISSVVISIDGQTEDILQP